MKPWVDDNIGCNARCTTKALLSYSMLHFGGRYKLIVTEIYKGECIEIISNNLTHQGMTMSFRGNSVRMGLLPDT